MVRSSATDSGSDAAAVERYEASESHRVWLISVDEGGCPCPSGVTVGESHDGLVGETGRVCDFCSVGRGPGEF